MRMLATLIFSVTFLSAAAQQTGPDVVNDPWLTLLSNSPRHQEWVRIPQGEREVQAFVVYPEIDHKAKSIVVIHENRGLNDWVRSVADRLAGEGYIAIAPDLLSGMGPEGGGTREFPDSDAARQAIYALDPDQVTADLTSVAEYVRSLPSANGVVVVGGFCWGGGQSFRLATNYQNAEAFFVFYGGAPKEGLERIAAPVFGFYGGNDERINATISPTAGVLDSLGKAYDPVIYDGAGHGFMRRAAEVGGTAADKEAMKQAWERWLDLLGGEDE